MGDDDREGSPRSLTKTFEMIRPELSLDDLG
jgi:hypothetical protein